MAQSTTKAPSKEKKKQKAKPTTSPREVSFLVVALDGAKSFVMGESDTRAREYTAELERLTKSVLRSLKDLRKGHGFVLEGAARYATLGFPDYDVPQLKRKIRDAAQKMLVAGHSDEHIEFWLTDNQCMIECFTCPTYLVDKIVSLWNAKNKARVDSSERGRLEAGAQGKRGRLQVSPQNGESTVDEFRTFLKQKQLVDGKQVESVFAALNKEVSRALKPCQRKVEAFLQELNRQVAASSERQFGSYEANRRFADELRELLHRIERRLKCPECGAPATLVCRQTRGSLNGSFQFYHRTEGKQMKHGTVSRIPSELTSVASDA